MSARIMLRKIVASRIFSNRPPSSASAADETTTSRILLRIRNSPSIYWRSVTDCANAMILFSKKVKASEARATLCFAKVRCIRMYV